MAALVVIAAALLWLLVAYLLLLGMVALIRPKKVLRFLFGFAQIATANTIEGLARLAVGIAFLILDEAKGWTPWGLVVGSFLALSALALLLAPGLHRRLAPRLVGLVQNVMPLLGIGALALGALLALLLASAG